MYEGRTRGKRLKYTFSDDEDFVAEGGYGLRRSTRGSSRDTPIDPTVPTVTQSGRQIRSRFGRSYGEPIHDANRSTPQNEDDELCGGNADKPLRGDGRPRRSGRAPREARDDYGSLDELDDEDEAVPSGDEWSGNDDDLEEKYDDDHAEEDDDDVMSDGADDKDSLLDEPRTLIVSLRYKTNPHAGMKQEQSLHDSALKESAISSTYGASSDATLGEVLKDSDVSARSVVVEHQPATAGLPDVAERAPKQEVSDIAMPDVAAHQQYSTHADKLQQANVYHDNDQHHTSEQLSHFATQAPQFVASSANW